MAGILGKAYIEVHADTKPFGRELEKELQVMLKAAQKQADVQGKEFGRRLGAAAGEGMRSSTHKAVGELKKELDKVKIVKKIGVEVERKAIQEVEQGVSFLANKFDDLTNGAKTFFSWVGKGFETMGNAAINALADINPVQVALYAIVGLLAVGLLGAVFVLIGALGQLLGLLGLIPGAFLAIAAIIAPLIIGFHGLGNAISLALSGKDPAKLAEELKKLAPSAREFVLEIQKAVPFFDKLKSTIQENLFANMRGQIDAIVKALGPTFIAGLGEISRQLGFFFGGLARFAASPAAKTMFQSIFYTASVLVNALSGPVLHLINAIGLMAVAAGPLIEQIAIDFGAWLNNLASFITQHVKDGSFQKWLQDAYDMFKKLVRVVGKVWDGLVVIYDWYKKDGSDLIDGISNFIERLTNWFKSDDGQRFLKGLEVAATAFLSVLVGILWVIGLIAEAMGALVEMWNWLTNNNAPGTTHSNPDGTDRRGGGSGYGPDEFNADGGIITKQTKSWLAEGDNPEVVIPLTKPARARQLVQESGLGAMMGGHGQTLVYVSIGNEPIDSRAYKVSTHVMGQQQHALASGPRGEF